MNYKGKFGQDPGQATIVIQTKHDRQEIKNRLLKQKTDENIKNFWFFHVDAGPITDEATSRIDRGDMVFTVGTTQAPRATSIMKTAPPVISALNGLYVRKERGEEKLELSNKDPEQVKLINNKLSRSLRFVGISLGWTNPTPDMPQQEKTQITTRIRGTGKVFNNGSGSFVIGDTVVWRLPTPKEVDQIRLNKSRYGRSTAKVTPIIMPLRHHMKEDLCDNMVAVMNAKNGNDFATKIEVSTSTEFSVLMKKFLVEIFLKGVKYGKNEAGDDFQGEGEANEKIKTLLAEIDTQAMRDKDDEGEDNGVQTFIKGNMFDGDADMKDKLNGLMLSFLEVHDDIKRRTVGTAQSYADPGQDVTIVINN